MALFPSLRDYLDQLAQRSRILENLSGKVSEDDASAGYLEDKLTEGNAVTITKQTDAETGVQTLEIAATGSNNYSPWEVVRRAFAGGWDVELSSGVLALPNSVTSRFLYVLPEGSGDPLYETDDTLTDIDVTVGTYHTGLFVLSAQTGCTITIRHNPSFAPVSGVIRPIHCVGDHDLVLHDFGFAFMLCDDRGDYWVLGGDPVFVPGTPGDWINPPSTWYAALDEIASRLQALDSAGGGT